MTVHRWLAIPIVAAMLCVSTVQAQSTEALMNAGQQLLRNGAYEAAVTKFRQALARNPNNFEAQHNLAFAYLNMGRGHEAVQAFKKALSLNGRSAETWANLAVAYENTGASDQAIDALYNAVNLDPGNLSARFNLATMYANGGRLNEAIAQFQEVIQIDGNNPEAYLNISKCLVNADRPAEAVRYLREAIALEPDNAEPHWELGDILWKIKGDTTKAENEFRMAVRLAPDAPKYYHSLANLLATQGKKDEAIETYRKSLPYIDDALVKENVRERIELLEGGGEKSANMAGRKPVVSSREDMEALEKGLRGDEEQRKEHNLLETSPLDITGDLEELEADDEPTFDLTNEAKERAKGK